jgi:hypothetical protein
LSEGAVKTSRGGLSKHLLLIIVLTTIYLAVVMVFLSTYRLAEPLGAMLAVIASFVTSLTILVLGARAFWQVAVWLSGGR